MDVLVPFRRLDALRSGVPEPLEPLLLTIPEAAGVLGVGRSTVYELIAGGRLETVHIGRACRVPVEGLLDFVDSLRAR